MTWRQRLDSLGERGRPHYGLLVLATLLLCGCPLVVYFLTHRPDPPGPGERVGPATVLSWLPAEILFDVRLQQVFGGAYFLGGLLWIAGRLVPWSGWLTALSFTAVVALYLESSNQCTHVAHMTAMLLWLYALWYHLYRREIRAALAAGRFLATPLYPHWVHAASVFYVGLFYGFSGLGKLTHSGPGWANGTSLQLWTVLFGDPHSSFSRMILSSRRLAAMLQWVTLIGETGGFVAIFSRTLRPFIGLLLIGFHIGQVAVFGWGFHANAAVIALVFLPFDTWVPALVRRYEKRQQA